jgi:signal peptidase I
MKKSRKIFLIIVSLISLIVVAGAVATLVFIRFVRIQAGSMMNTIIPGDRVMSIRYLGGLERGDIVAFKLPTKPQIQYIKRVIGLPGETILLRGTKVFIDGKELSEARTFVDLTDPQKSLLPEISREGVGKYRVYYDVAWKGASEEPAEMRGEKYAVMEPYLIPEGQYFVLGDCRDNSLDSRYWGAVPRELITGRCLMIADSAAPGGEKRVFLPLK